MAGEHPTLASERANSPFPEKTMRHFLDGSSRASQLWDCIQEELEEVKRKEQAGEPIDLGDGTMIDSNGILPNEDHSLEEARQQTMKMIRFQV